MKERKVAHPLFSLTKLLLIANGCRSNLANQRFRCVNYLMRGKFYFAVAFMLWPPIVQLTENHHVMAAASKLCATIGQLLIHFVLMRNADKALIAISRILEKVPSCVKLLKKRLHLHLAISFLLIAVNGVLIPIMLRSNISKSFIDQFFSPKVQEMAKNEHLILFYLFVFEVMRSYEFVSYSLYLIVQNVFEMFANEMRFCNELALIKAEQGTLKRRDLKSMRLSFNLLNETRNEINKLL